MNNRQISVVFFQKFLHPMRFFSEVDSEYSRSQESQKPNYRCSTDPKVYPRCLRVWN